MRATSKYHLKRVRNSTFEADPQQDLKKSLESCAFSLFSDLSALLEVVSMNYHRTAEVKFRIDKQLSCNKCIKMVADIDRGAATDVWQKGVHDKRL